tara:strand:- start:392 stop:1132 length:741 start_codon:yes stop_codon:yes gene_type:complete
MIKHLSRINSNNSGIYVTKVFDKNGTAIELKKSSSRPDSINNLKKELVGAEWYSRISQNKLVTQVRELPLYYSLTFRYVDGYKANYRDGYIKNSIYIEKAISLYCEIWSQLSEDDLCVHGDFSIDNLIFAKKNPTIIDWEHFSKKSIPIGFDALNLIFEQLFFSRADEKINSKVINHIRIMLKKLKKYHCLGEEFLSCPLSKMRNIIIKNSEIWGNQITKLPVMKIKPEDISKLDRIICKETTYQE